MSYSFGCFKLALCLKLNEELMCLTAALYWNVKECQQFIQEGPKKVEGPSLNATIKHCRTKSARIAAPNRLTESYTRFLLKTLPYQFN